MVRLQRRLQFAARMPPAPAVVTPEQVALESALRGRAARRVRTWLRRMEPVVVGTPRWSRPEQFLEHLALDLALGEPAIGCRTVSFKGMGGRPLPQVWQFIIHVFGQLGRRGWEEQRPFTVADRTGFRFALRAQLEAAHRELPHRVALLAHAAECLPVDVVEDLSRVWEEYDAEHPDGRRCVLLLAGAVQAEWLRIGLAPRVELVDFGADEAASALTSRAGAMSPRQVEAVARFTGGVPELVESIGAVGRFAGRLPVRPDELLLCLGRIGDELRGAIDIATADDAAADRLHDLLDGEPRLELPAVDRGLWMAGLVRRLPPVGTEAMVVLRAPAFAAMVA
jgi:hypothetical protein